MKTLRIHIFVIEPSRGTFKSSQINIQNECYSSQRVSVAGVANPRLANCMWLLARFQAALTQLPETPQNSMHAIKWLVKFCIVMLTCDTYNLQSTQLSKGTRSSEKMVWYSCVPMCDVALCGNTRGVVGRERVGTALPHLFHILL